MEAEPVEEAKEIKVVVVGSCRDTKILFLQCYDSLRHHPTAAVDHLLESDRLLYIAAGTETLPIRNLC